MCEAPLLVSVNRGTPWSPLLPRPEGEEERNGLEDGEDDSRRGCGGTQVNQVYQ